MLYVQDYKFILLNVSDYILTQSMTDVGFWQAAVRASPGSKHK
jgi:hypothetical protein